MWLDHAHIQAGYAVRPAHGWLALFREPFAHTGFYRPLMALSLSLDALIGSTTWFHFVNLVWHAAAAVLAMLAARELGLSRRAATLAAVLFAVHPLASLPADAIAFRSEAIITVALLGLIVAHRRGRPGWAVAAILVGALSKETALALAPLFIVALELGFRSLKKPLLAAEAAALAVAGGLRLAYAPAWQASFPDLSPSEAVGTRLAALAKSILAFVAPLQRTICDAFPVTRISAPMSLLGLLAAALIVWLVAKKGPVALLMALAILPSLQLVPTLRWWSPHYLYVASAFGAMLVAAAVVRVGDRAVMGLLLVVVGLAVVSWNDGRRYANDQSLWRPEVRADVACREGHFYLGEAARAQRDFAAAAAHFEDAVRPRPGVLAYVDLDAALQNLGVARLELGQWPAARRAFEAALEVATTPETRRELTHDLALAHLRAGEPRAAVELLAPLVARPDAAPATVMLYARARRAARLRAPGDLLAPVHER